MSCRSHSDSINWLKSIAKNDETRRNLDIIKAEQDRFDSEKKQPDNDAIIELNFKYHTIWTTLKTSYGFLRVYVPIFKENEHSKLDDFKNLNINKPVIIDIGANEGYYSLKMSYENPEASIFSIEPNPITFEYLKRNIYGNLPNKIKLFNIGIGRNKGEEALEYVEEISRIASQDISKLGFEWLDKSRIQRITINIETLEDFCICNHIDKVDLLKIDTEGAELDIIETSTKVLSFTKKLVVEYHSINIRNKIFQIMSNLKWEFLFEDIDTPSIGDLYFTNKSL